MQTQSHTLTPQSLPMHWQTSLSLLLPTYHPHRDKSSLLHCIKPGLISTVLLRSRSYSWSLLSAAELLHNLPSVSIRPARKQVTHTYTETEKKLNNNIFLFFLFFSLFGNCRVNIFINHITWHDAPKFTLSVYRNTLNRTQGFTMDTRLTFCPLHLQQWMTFSRFFVSFFSRWFPLPSLPCRSYPSNLRPPDSLTKAFYFAVAVEVFSSCFTNTICIETIHRLDVSEYEFCSTVVNSQYESATYTMLMQ